MLWSLETANEGSRRPRRRPSASRVIITAAPFAQLRLLTSSPIVTAVGSALDFPGSVITSLGTRGSDQSFGGASTAGQKDAETVRMDRAMRGKQREDLSPTKRTMGLCYVQKRSESIGKFSGVSFWVETRK